MIPLSSLAAMLVVTGYRLFAPFEIGKIYREGKSPFLVYMTTLTVTVATDLLVGVCSGVVLYIILVQAKKFAAQET